MSAPVRSGSDGVNSLAMWVGKVRAFGASSGSLAKHGSVRSVSKSSSRIATSYNLAGKDCPALRRELDGVPANPGIACDDDNPPVRSGVLPHRHARAGRSPDLHRFIVRSTTPRDPGEQFEH